jgi:hypothetical protein
VTVDPGGRGLPGVESLPDTYDVPELETLEDARALVARLLEVTKMTLERRGQLERALESRIVIEQAKGVLAERLRITPDRAFELLRRAARTNQLNLRGLAQEVVESRITPPEIEEVVRKTDLLDV